MRGAVYHFVEMAERIDPRETPHVILASDYLNVSDWRALAPKRLRDVPVAIYFHENQLSYPLADDAPIDHQFGWINLSSALTADLVLFNSEFHRQEFLHAVDQGLRRMPDYVPHGVASRLDAASGVFPVGIDFEPHREVLARHLQRNASSPVILWNHRWEYDKDPNRMVEALIGLKRRGVEFHAILCGQIVDRSTSAYVKASSELGDRILHQGFYSDSRDYLKALAQADVVLSTAKHEFFGVSVVEALYMGCLPVLPNALSYVELLPKRLHEEFLYPPDCELTSFLESFIADLPVDRRAELRAVASQFDWSRIAGTLDQRLESLV